MKSRGINPLAFCLFFIIIVFIRKWNYENNKESRPPRKYYKKL